MSVIAIGGEPENLPKAARGASLREIWDTLKSSLTALAMPVIILGGILGGIVTPTEATTIAVAYALFIGIFVYRTLTLKSFYMDDVGLKLRPHIRTHKTIHFARHQLRAGACGITCQKIGKA